LEKSNKTKDQILEASLKLFSEKSYHGASVRDIAKIIGKRESSIYNHFKSKEEILEQIIFNFSNRNFGPIVLTDKLINTISKPEKFFLLLAENLIDFWTSDNERMFIKLLLSRNTNEKDVAYSLDIYLIDFRNLCEFILKEMMNHTFIGKSDERILSREYISPLFIFLLESIVGNKPMAGQKTLIKKHVDFFWGAIKP